jgi:hypothetical protein
MSPIKLFKYKLKTSFSNDANVSGKSNKTQYMKTGTGISASGGSIFTPGNGYKYHIFTAPGNFIVGNGGLIDYILVGGGGGGGGTSPTNSYGSGGGGAGGYRSLNGFYIASGTYSIAIGNGGSADTNGSPTTLSGPSSFTTLTAGGGGGGGIAAVSGAAGGSGGGGGGAGPGGGSGNIPAIPAALGGPQGSPGGPGAPTSYVSGGGGGGAGQTGGPGPGAPGTAGIGGNGLPAFQGDTGIPISYGTPGPAPGRYFAGGGSGGVYPTNSGRVSGGAGGGGAGGAYPFSPASPGTINTGGGGGGASYTAGAGSGGPGIVIIRYLNI